MKRLARHNFIGALGAGGLVLAFCFILLWRDPLLFWNDDYAVSILPVFADVARSWSEGELPLLSPYSWVCGNLAGEFQYGTFSIFVNGAVVAIWKFALTFPQQAAALSLVHLFVLAMGGYLLARGRDFSPALSTMVALVAALNGWIISWGATDWFGALGAFAWLPWAWWGMERALDPRRTRWRFLWPAPFVYLLVTGGFPYTVLMLGVLAGWLALRALIECRKLSAIWPLLLGIVLGFGLSAPAWLALLDYVQGSARAAQDSAQHLQWRVPVSALPGFLLPNWTVKWVDFSTRLMPHTATELACGLVPPVALLAGLIVFGRALVARIKWELGLLVLLLLLSLLPSAGVFRWSFRWLPFLHLALALCAAEALRSFASFTPARLKSPGTIGFILLLVSFAAGWLLGAIPHHTSTFVWPTLGLAAVWALLGMLPTASLRAWLPALVTIASLVITYLCLSPNCGVPKYNLSQQLTGPSPLDPQRLYLSVYPPPEEAYRIEKRPEPFGTTLRVGSTSMWGGVRLVNGYSPIRTAGVAREFAFAIHGEVPAWMGEWLLEYESWPDGILARLGVDGIIVANETPLVPRPESEWELAAATDEGRIFHRRGGPFSRVRSVGAIDSRPDEQFARAEISRIVDGRKRLEAEVMVPEGGKPALLTISRPFFKGYQARVGERSLKVDSYRSLFPLVEVPAGTKGRLTLVYRPRWLIWGGLVAGLSLLIVAAGAVAALFSRPGRASAGS